MTNKEGFAYEWLWCFYKVTNHWYGLMPSVMVMDDHGQLVEANMNQIRFSLGA